MDSPAPRATEAQLNIKYRVVLSQEEREDLVGMLKGGKLAARKLVRAQILLAADKGISDEGIAGTLQVSGRRSGDHRLDLHDRKSSRKTQKGLSGQRVMIPVHRY